MKNLLTLIDGSLYAPSVCDHAAWAAKRLKGPVELVHALGRREGGGAPKPTSPAASTPTRATPCSTS
jgi:hypothetical protein